MTRRKFVQKLIHAGSAVIAGTCWLAKKAAPRKFVRAIKVKNYPGSLRPLRDISKQSKWSG
jgi:hypothetical protein